MAPRPLRSWESAVDQQIREAQERGDFDALPGYGKPLAAEPWEGDWALAHHVLRQAGETLPWISLGQDIEKAEAKLSRLLEEAKQRPPDRERLRIRYLEAAADLDRLLQEFAFSVPIRSLERGRLPQHVAAKQFDAACPP